jgi:hypothetical protein
MFVRVRLAFIIFVVAVITITITGCGGNNELQATATIVPTSTPVIPSGVEPQKRQLFIETYPQNNCGGVSEVVSMFRHEYSITYIVNFGQELAISVDGRAGIPGVGQIQIGAEVATHYNVSYGSVETKVGQIELKAKEKKRVEHILKHLELVDRGTVIVTVGTMDHNFSYSFPVGYRVELQDTVEIPCPANAVTTTSTITPGEVTTPTASNTPPLPEILPTPIPFTIGTLIVPADTNEGIKFDVPAAGRYYFKYLSGSYSVYPENNIPEGTKTWLTAVRIFKNREIEWNDVEISDSPDLSASDFGYYSTLGEAEARAQGSTATISLKEGDYLILVAVDGRPYYSDNPGQVVYEVLYTPE